LDSLYYKICSKVSETMTMIKYMSSIVSIVYIYGLLALDFFHDVGFLGETFLLLEVSSSSR
jgi:hypothetical protein